MTSKPRAEAAAPSNRLRPAKVADRSAAIAAASLRPHRILGREGGHFSPGAPADLCVFDPALRWTVTDDTLVSSGRNTPYFNHAQTGRVIATMVGGEWVFQATV